MAAPASPLQGYVLPRPTVPKNGVVPVLVITRKVGEEIEIGGGVRVKVLGVRGQRVSIGIDAPRKVRVSRVDVKERPTLEPIHGTQR